LTYLFEIITVLNACFFLFYGFQSLNSSMMIEEFKRFGMNAQQRKITGILQILAAIGLILGLRVSLLGVLSAGGLTAMMLVAFIVRLKIRDSFIQSVPSVLFMLINAWLTHTYYTLF
jgi:uncharacterized membrane protein YkgB